MVDPNQRKGRTELHTFLRPSFDIKIVLEPGFESPGPRKKWKEASGTGTFMANDQTKHFLRPSLLISIAD